MKLRVLQAIVAGFALVFQLEFNFDWSWLEKYGAPSLGSPDRFYELWIAAFGPRW
jgi:hypothetical protein